jgi:hypothetical protein
MSSASTNLWNYYEKSRGAAKTWKPDESLGKVNLSKEIQEMRKFEIL